MNLFNASSLEEKKKKDSIVVKIGKLHYAIWESIFRELYYILIESTTHNSYDSRVMNKGWKRVWATETAKRA